MVIRIRNWGLWSCLILAASPVVAQEAPAKPANPTPPDNAAGIEFFEKKIRPILVDNCYNCHSANTNAKGGLRVDDFRGLIHGGSSGAAIVPGKPEESLLIQAVNYDGFEMPPKKRLSPEQIADLTQWVKDGAAWPKLEVSVDLGKSNAKYDALKAEHWAWQPLRAGEVPEVQNQAWARSDVDRFVLARLEQEGLKPTVDADKLTLLRRVTFDLTGLPPTTAEIAAFTQDSSANAFETVVDRLLASPAFGERWGRHWLDVARYGESTGSSRNVPYPHAWRYRDYVIDAFNQDKPYDQFVREQIAGDLLPAATPEARDEQTIATGFLALGVKDVNQRFKVRFVMDNIDEQIDTVSRSVLALTASCARCHDHKFDPIPTKDYYALAGIFHSTDLCAGVRNKMGGGGLDYYDTQALLYMGNGDGPNPAQAEKLAAAKQAVAEARKAFEHLRDNPAGAELAPNGRPQRQVARQKLNRLQAELNALTDPASNGAKVAFGVRDAKQIGDTEVRLRGEAEKLGPVVPRGFLSVVNVPDAPTINAVQSGRLELAAWLTSPQNPLTPRVIANRIWQHLFGQGLVTTVDNFGVTGDKPSHPELLDHLAWQFVKEGWSIKRQIRTIVLTRAYQLSSAEIAANQNVDPANRLVWRHSPRRLDAEEIRDAMLAAGGKLNLSRPEASPAKSLKVIEIRNNGNEARDLETKARASSHRSVYLPLLRGLTPTSLAVFDFAEQGMVTGSRDTTTVAPQALYLLNDPFVRRQALQIAENLAKASNIDDDARVTQVYQLTVGRDPTAQEVAKAKQYLADYATLLHQVAATEVTPEKVEPVAEVAATEPASTNGDATDAKPAVKKPAEVIDPDQVITADEPIREEVITIADAKTAAWASFCQALLGTAEFRFLR